MTKQYVLYYKIMNGSQLFEEKYITEDSPEKINKKVMEIGLSVKTYSKQFFQFKELKIVEMTVFEKAHTYDLVEMKTILDQPVQLELKEQRENPFAYLKDMVEESKKEKPS